MTIFKEKEKTVYEFQIKIHDNNNKKYKNNLRNANNNKNF